MRMRIVGFVAGLLFVVLPKGAFAWHTQWGQDTHYHISTASVQNLAQDHLGGYPDLEKFKMQISNGANEESHTIIWDRTACDNSRNGGFPKAWWDDGKDEDTKQDNAVFYYNALNQPMAYRYIGRMAHLIQDQAVPAHAANIRHGYGELWQRKLDDMELSAGIHYSYRHITTSLKSLPYSFYQSLQTNTIGQLKYWIDPKSGRQYWYPNINAPAGDATFGPFGFYGGDLAKDIYDYSVQPAPAIMFRQIDKTSEYTQGALMSASELLPPVVYGLEIPGTPEELPVISVKYLTPVRFTVTENRHPDVKVDVYVEGLGAIKTSEPAVSLFEPDRRKLSEQNRPCVFNIRLV